MSWLKKVTKQTWIAVGGFALAIVIALSVFLGVVASGNKNPVAGTEEETVNYDDGLVVKEGESHGIALLSTSFTKTITVDDVEKEVKVERVTASFDEGFDSENILLDWEITGWKNTDHNEWALDKSVEEYVCVTPTSDGALSADVSCYQPFGEIAILRASVRGNADIYAECELGYRQGFFGLSASIVYENEENAKTNLAWLFSEEESIVVPFAGSPVSFEEFISNYCAADYTNFTVTTSLTDIYTDEAIVENVKVEVCYNSAYRTAIALNGGLVTTAASEYVILGEGSGKEAVIHNVTFRDVLMLPEEGLDYSGFKQSLKASVNTARLSIKITATVNGEEYTKTYMVRFDSDSFVIYPDSVELDHDRVVFG